MERYEQLYIKALTDITNSPVQLNKRTGVRTFRKPHVVFDIDLSKELPLLKSKKVNWEVALNEILWIMQQQSNNVEDLKSHIWDAWADRHGSIGKSYGYQVAQPVVINNKVYDNQVDYVLKTLANDSSDRRCVIDMWQVADINEMALTPCVYSSIWNIIDGKLNCMLIQRSGDMPVGVPFDSIQYAILTHMFARHLQVDVGTFTHVIADAHIYENQLKGVSTQLMNYGALNHIDEATTVDEYTISNSHPTLSFRAGAPHNFWEMSESDIFINDYYNMGTIRFPVTA